jgi:hypothetical protein
MDDKVLLLFHYLELFRDREKQFAIRQHADFFDGGFSLHFAVDYTTLCLYIKCYVDQLKCL